MEEGFFCCSAEGGKLWRLSYRFASKQKTLALGVFPQVTLKDAREARTVAKAHLARGVDPSEDRKIARRKFKLAEANTFSEIAREWFDNQKDGWTTAYSDRIWR